MGDDFWKPTADCFSQLFSKPKMTEKLLLRPPFRYIHDIYTATMQATGFGEGLYSEEELDAKSIKDKDGKVNFLEKLIALVQLAAGEELPVKSSKVVAGQEPEATNIFLQYLFKVATSGIDSGPIVSQILGGDEGGEDQQEDDGQDDAEEQARLEAEAEEQRKKEKRAAKKKEMEAQKAKEQQEAEAARQKEADAKAKAKAQKEKEAAAASAAAAASKAKAKKPEPVPEPVKKQNIIEEGHGDDDDDNIVGEEPEDDMIGGGLDDVAPESAFGKKAMQQLKDEEDEDDAERINDDAGGSGGIKMGKIGNRRGRKKAGGVERSEPQKKALVTANEPPKRSYGGYSDEDIEHMRKAIQSLCQSTNPLGKSIDFVTEDIDSMIKEYDHWKLDYAESQSKLEEQQRITEQTIQPLQDVELAQLEEKIREEKSKIQNIRSQIIRNDNTIQNLLQSVISSG